MSFKIKKNDEAEMDKYLTCPICLEFLKQTKVLQCSHKFCTSCIREVQNSKCPICSYE